MCVKILLGQLEAMRWDGESALASDCWRLQYVGDPWTKGLSVTLILQNLKEPRDARRHRKIVLRRGQEAKLVRSMLQLWVEGTQKVRSGWLDKKVGSGTRIGPNVQQFVSSVFSRYRDADDVTRDRAMDDLRRAVRRAQSFGLTEDDLKQAWDEGLFAQMLAS